MRGNVLVPGYDLPGIGLTRSLGGLPDGATGTAVYLLYNSVGAHRIVRYDPTANGGAGASTTLLEWPGLNLTQDLPIGLGVNGCIIDGLLVYRDSTGEQRCVDLARVSTYTPDFLAAEPFALHLLKVPPTDVLTLQRTTQNTGAPGEALRIIQDKPYQFAYRYRYVNGEVTVLSPYSEWLDVTDDPVSVRFNVIGVELPFLVPTGVQDIELLVRTAATMSWQIADTIKRDAAGNLAASYLFYGQILGDTIATAEAIRPFENLWPSYAGPTVARSRVFAADFLEGYPTPEPAFTATVAVTGPTGLGNSRRTLHERSTYRVTVQYYDVFGRAAGCSRPVTVRVPARATGSDSLRYMLLQLTTTGTAALNAEIPAWAYSYQFLVARNDRTTFFLQGQSGDTLGYSGEKRTINNDTGSVTETHRFSDVNKDKHQKTWVDIGNFAGAGQGYVWQVGDVLYIRDINKEFVITGQQGDYLEIPYDGPIPKNSAGLTVPFIEIYTPNTTPGAVYYERGPRMRILRDAQGNRSYTQSLVAIDGDCFLIPLLFSNIIRSDEYASDSNNNKDYEPATAATLVESMVPFYRLAPTSTSIVTEYQEVERGVLDGGLLGLISDRKDVTVRTSSTTAVDTAARPATALLWLDMGFGGRPSLVVPTALQQVRRNIERFSGQKQQGNLINGLSRWEALNQYDKFPQEQGRITALVLADQSQTDGKVLLALQQYGEVSQYLNQQPIRTGTDDVLIATTDQVVGGDNTLNGGYGCTDPASIQAYAGKVFYYCRERQELLRYNNGLTPLGLTYKFSQRLQEAAARHGDAPVRGCFDPRRQEYHLTFGAGGEVLGETFVWSEKRLAWADRISYTPEAGLGLGNELVTWQTGQLYRHTPTAPVGTFFGAYTPPSFSVTIATADEAAKRWMSLELRTEGGLWNAVRVSTDTGQESRTLPEWWQRREGVWLLPEGLRRNELTPGYDNPVQALYEGYPLVSPRATFTFVCPEIDPQPVSQVNISWLPRAGGSLGVSG
jgi:hypothetical protein